MAKLRGYQLSEVDEREFTSFAVFGIYLERMRRNTHEAINEGLVEAAEVVLEDVESQFGHYQPQVGPFPEWAPLSQATLDRRERRGINPEDEPLLESTALSESYSVVRNGDEIALGSDSDYADIQENGGTVGNRSIPPRPVVGPAIIRTANYVTEDILAAFVDVLLHGRRFKDIRKSKAAMRAGVTPNFGGGSYTTGDSVT